MNPCKPRCLIKKGMLYKILNNEIVYCDDCGADLTGIAKMKEIRPAIFKETVEVIRGGKE